MVGGGGAKPLEREAERSMEQALFEQVAASFAAFHPRFAPLFGRREAQRRSEQYLRGLLVQQTDRRHAENVAEMIDGASPRARQRLLTDAPWAADPVIATLRAFLGERLAAADGVFVLDDTGFVNQGTQSVGVGRQYSTILRDGGQLPDRRLSRLRLPTWPCPGRPASVSAAQRDGRPGAQSAGGGAGCGRVPEPGGVGAGDAAAGAGGWPSARTVGDRG